jgi:hypothetical protein
MEVGYMSRANSRPGRSFSTNTLRLVIYSCCAALLVPCGPIARAQSAPAAAKIPNDQLDSLVAPIALYPDPLLSQTLVAATYPLEIIQLQQWLAKNKNLKDKALTDAAMKQPWDPSIQAMVALPDVVARLANDIQWTTDLGNAFLAQQSDVMDAVQRMRKKAQGTGALTSNEQQTVETKVIENKTVVVVEPASTQVVYVPSYSPTVVYGPPIYPYPPIYYPPYPAGAIVASSMISFGVGVAMGAAWGGGWGWGCGWGGNDIDINVNNNFNRNNIRNTNVSGNRVGNSNKWSHDSRHRGGAPYGDRGTADRFGGTARGDSLASRQSGARTQPSGGGAARQPANTGARTGGAGSGDAVSNRSTGGGVGGAGATGSNRSAGGGDRVGNREVPRSSGSGGSGAFSGSSGGGSRARESSSRGSHSAGGSRGGGRRR